MKLKGYVLLALVASTLVGCGASDETRGGPSNEESTLQQGSEPVLIGGANLTCDPVGTLSNNVLPSLECYLADSKKSALRGISFLSAQKVVGGKSETASFQTNDSGAGTKIVFSALSIVGLVSGDKLIIKASKDGTEKTFEFDLSTLLSLVSLK